MNTPNFWAVISDTTNRPAPHNTPPLPPTIQSTNSAQWQKIADAMNVRDEDGNVDLTITLTGKPLMRQDGTYETSYATATDVTLFRELLSFLSNGRMSSITVIQSAGTTDSAPVYMMKDGVKWVWIP